MQDDGAEDNDSFPQASLSELPHNTTSKGENNLMQNIVEIMLNISGDKKFNLSIRCQNKMNVSGVVGGKVVGSDGNPSHWFTKKILT